MLCELDINGGEYCRTISDVFIKMVKANSYEEAKGLIPSKFSHGREFGEGRIEDTYLREVE